MREKRNDLGGLKNDILLSKSILTPLKEDHVIFLEENHIKNWMKIISEKFNKKIISEIWKKITSEIWKKIISDLFLKKRDRIRNLKEDCIRFFLEKKIKSES